MLKENKSEGDKKKDSSSFFSQAPPKPSANLKGDFKSFSVLSRHVKGLSDADKVKFAEKYGVSYKDVSEIRGNAKRQYNN